MRHIQDILNEDRKSSIRELESIGIRGLQFASYSDDGDELFTITKYGNPDKYFNTWVRKLETAGWTKIDNSDYPENDNKDNSPIYMKPTIYESNGWYCLLFKRWGFGLDGISIWLKRKIDV